MDGHNWTDHGTGNITECENLPEHTHTYIQSLITIHFQLKNKLGQ